MELVMKISYQILLRNLLIGFCLLSTANAADKEWMVKITKKVGNETITGSGYLVKVGNKTYVRTA